MMRVSSAALLLVTTPALAQDFSAGSEAQSWGLYAEAPARFEAQVVDILCELSGDCPENCGDGARQLGLVRSADDVLVYPNKNNQPAFTGAVVELLPFCGETVEVDGLMLTDPDLGAVNVYLVQKIRLRGETDWTAANGWTRDWATRHPELAEIEGPWFRKDPRVLAAIEREGYFGLGLEQDAAAIKELYE